MLNSQIKWSEDQERSIFGEAAPELIQRFKEFHDQNGFIYLKFFEKAVQILNRGRKKYSAWTIINVIRWETDLNITSEDFMINNDFIALYARLLMFHHPIFKDFFHLRSMKTSRRLISQEQKERILSNSYKVGA